jgi:hypothetical protein
MAQIVFLDIMVPFNLKIVNLILKIFINCIVNYFLRVIILFYEFKHILFEIWIVRIVLFILIQNFEIIFNFIHTFLYKIILVFQAHACYM